ncbi:MAG: hypothetical protein M0Z94_13600 [Dehalococcoidales bacterium]|nr:hypothetical protein [Dehalococcoidales bacterium]
MDTRERILTTIAWGEPDQVPLTCFQSVLPRGQRERLLRDAGVGLVLRPPAHRVRHREVEIITREYWEAGQRRLRRTIHTPVGDVWQTLVPDVAYDTSNWIVEHFIKGPDDYRVMEFYMRDAIFEDDYESLREAQRRIGGDGLVYVRVAKTPVQEMLYQMMGVERFGIDYYEHRDLFDSLYHTMCERYDDLFDIAAGSPVEMILMGDNISGDVVGEERFRGYIMPIYKRLREKLSGTGKLTAAHMDGRLRSFVKLIGEADLDVIEALTPPPMGNLSIADAREAWPGKALWINFTSSMHITTPEAIEEHTRHLLEEAGTKRGFAIGVTEDAPVEALERSLGVISRVLRAY